MNSIVLHVIPLKMSFIRTMLNFFMFALDGAGVIDTVLGFLIYSNGKDMGDYFKKLPNDRTEKIGELSFIKLSLV